MADFWGGVKDWWGDITGGTQKKTGQADLAAAQKAATAASGAAGDASTTLGAAGQTATDLGKAQATQGAAYDKGAASSMGANAAEMAANADATARKQAAENATAASQNVLQGARTSGLNAGQAAQLAGQSVGGAYTGGLQAGRDQYAQNTQMFANQGNTKAGLGLQGNQQAIGAAGQQGQLALGQGNLALGQGTLAQGQANAGQQQGKDFWGGITGLATAGLGLLSDERAKEDIKDSSKLDEAAEKIAPKEYSYKDGDGGKELGVIAQDVEKVMPQNVKDTPQGKVIDVARQTGSNTALLMEVARRLRALEKKAG